MNTEEERLLLKEIKLNPLKFSALYDEYYHAIFSYIFRRLTDYEAARDIASEVFLKAYLNIQSFEWRGVSLVYWLFRIATNEINLRFGKPNYHSQSFDYLINKNALKVLDEQTASHEKELLENELKQHEEFLMIQMRIKQLPVKYQEVICLKYFENKSIKDISIIINKKEGTIKSILSRGIEKLKNLL